MTCLWFFHCFGFKFCMRVCQRVSNLDVNSCSCCHLELHLAIADVLQLQHIALQPCNNYCRRSIMLSFNWLIMIDEVNRYYCLCLVLFYLLHFILIVFKIQLNLLHSLHVCVLFVLLCALQWLSSSCWIKRTKCSSTGQQGDDVLTSATNMSFLRTVLNRFLFIASL